MSKSYDPDNDAGIEGVQERFRENLRGWESHLFLLRRAIASGDPKAELLIRVDDVLGEVRAALIEARGD